MFPDSALLFLGDVHFERSTQPVPFGFKQRGDQTLEVVHSGDEVESDLRSERQRGKCGSAQDPAGQRGVYCYKAILGDLPVTGRWD